MSNHIIPATRRDCQPQIDLHTGRTTISCPACAGDTTYKPNRVTCPGCGWTVLLTPAEAFDYFGGLTCFKPDVDCGLFLKVKHASTSPPPEPPPKVLSCKPTATTHKAVVLPEGPNESRLTRLERLADQFGLDGGDFRLGPTPTTLDASSQERDDADNTAVRWYTIQRAGNRWVCACKAGERDICAHRAGYWRHLDSQLRDPDVELTPERRAKMERIYREIMTQAGVVAPVAPKPARSDAELAAAAAQARADLFGVAS
jgi:hypothetical protein